MFHQLSAGARRDQGGVTLIELLITITIFGIMLAIGIPAMGGWMMTSKARAASEFYLDGFATARRQAVLHNAASRIVLSANPNSGQFDWQIDLCYPVPGTPCNANSGVWSTTAAPAPNDPQGAAGFKSVFRSADALPDSEVLIPSMTPVGATQIYYTALGWVDPAAQPRLTQLRLDPAPRMAGKIPVVALSITLAGMPSKCDPTLAATDSRACPP
jgi:type IV fimbrial biogenesis protein FimT